MDIILHKYMQLNIYNEMLLRIVDFFQLDLFTITGIILNSFSFPLV